MCENHQNEMIVRDIPKGPAAKAGVGMIRFYQSAISPLLPAACRFEPSCSQYTLIAIQRFGLVKGSFMGMGRISRCHPFHEGGYDPVPEKK